MFGLGISEIIVIVLAVILLIRPKDLPAIARKVGGYYRSVMKQVNGVRSEIRKLAVDLEADDEAIEPGGSVECKENRRK